MAYLNVRERRIEAKIAYVGPRFAGRHTNFDRLRRSTGEGRIGRVDAVGNEGDSLSVAWSPSDGARFRDCDVLVEVVAPRGGSDPENIPDLLGDVDGVVLVVDAAPLSQTQNRAAAASLRSALRRPGREQVPVVLQINKTDLHDALSLEQVVSGLDAAELPHVGACATTGRGVVETLETALTQILRSMQRNSEASPDAGGAEKDHAGDTGHPLLAALRQVLRETVREHMVEVEARLSVRIDAALRPVAARLEALQAASTDARSAIAEVADLLSEVAHRTTGLTDRAHATLEALRRLDRTSNGTMSENQ